MPAEFSGHIGNSGIFAILILSGKVAERIGMRVNPLLESGFGEYSVKGWRKIVILPYFGRGSNPSSIRALIKSLQSYASRYACSVWQDGEKVVIHNSLTNYLESYTHDVEMIYKEGRIGAVEQAREKKAEPESGEVEYSSISEDFYRMLAGMSESVEISSLGNSLHGAGKEDFYPEYKDQDIDAAKASCKSCVWRCDAACATCSIPSRRGSK